MNNYQGDLADIVRASGSNINIDNTATITTATATATINNEQMSNGQFVSSPKLYPFSDPLRITDPASMFPFYDVSLENNRIEGAASLRQLPVSCPIQISPNTTTDHDIPCGRRSNSKNNHDGCKDQVNKLPITQVSAVSSSRVNTNAAHRRLMSSQMNMNNINVSSSISPKDIVFLDTTAGLQISSPRNPGIKRRKSQAKKVVCIPAPAAANSRQTGEVVPSDLWAWRKYGQKPIKGSPYPRGYYRCSSSKGCSARKQVERSRTNANMLVITYTSEHNHPWPTQRNALAGSTRSQLSKSSGAVGSSESLQPTSGQLHNGSQTRTRNDTNNVIVKEDTNNGNAKKEERGEEKTDAIEVINDDKEEYDLADSYRPIMGEPNNISEQPDQDFFADLVDQFEGNHDPSNLLFTQQGKLALDPFGGLFDWGAPDSTNITSTVQNNDQNPSTSSGQGKKES